jgi:hypothetical protein
VQGSVMDVALHIGSQFKSVGWKNAAALGTVEGQWPLNTDSNISGTYRSNAPKPMRANYGLNWVDIAFGTASIATPGFLLDGNGNIKTGALSVTTTGNTTSIDTTLLHVTNSVVVGTPTTGWLVGMGLYDASGNQWLCTSIDGSGRITGVSAVPIGPAFVTSAPANPVAVTDQSGAFTATLTLTWSSAPALSLQPGGGTLQIGSGCVAANGSVATVLGSLGPAGSHTTVQEWMAVKTAGGTTRYIPCF